MKKGRRKDHLWRFVRYKGDIGIYARCSCGFWYHCSKPEDPEHDNLRRVIDENKMYNYCPNCGARKTRYDPEVKRINRYSWE